MARILGAGAPALRLHDALEPVVAVRAERRLAHDADSGQAEAAQARGTCLPCPLRGHARYEQEVALRRRWCHELILARRAA